MTDATKKHRADVHVGIPTNEGVLHQSMYGAYERAVTTASRKGLTIARTLTNNANLPLALTNVVKTATYNNSKYVLFLGADIVIPEDAILKLIDRKVPIVSGIYPQTVKPYFLEAYIQKDKNKPVEHFMDVESEGIHEVTYTGFGCCLIEVKVFEEMKHPWFVLTPEVLESEYFYQKARTLGFKAHVDASVKCGRLGIDYYTVNDSLYNIPTTPKEEVVEK